MRPSVNVLLHAFAAAMVAAFAATAAAAGPGDGRSSAWMRVQQLPTGGSMTGTGQQVEIHSFHWGPRQSTSADGARTAGDPDRPVIAGSVPNSSASKRQHGAVTIAKEWDAATPQLARPLARGSVRVRVATPWTGCRVGAHYPSLELGDGGGKNYLLQDVTVASCGGSGDADDRPTEEVAFYYNRIAFNYAR